MYTSEELEEIAKRAELVESRFQRGTKVAVITDPASPDSDGPGFVTGHTDDWRVYVSNHTVPIDPEHLEVVP